jgi:hypothetical protein
MLPATSSGAVASSCASGGRCRIGDVGPGGGVIFYVASGPQWWGSYLEARPVSRTGVAWSLRPQDSLYGDSDKNVVQRRRIDAKALGMGRVNTEAIVEQSGPGTYAAAVVARQTLGGKRDWFLPSKNELNALYNFRALQGYAALVDGPYWTSTEGGGRNVAWYQMFQDGTQFTDSHELGSTTGSKVRKRSFKHPGSAFPSRPYRLVAVRAFGDVSGEMPALSLPALTGNTCTDAGPCVVGDIGPAGGVVFYVAPKRESWGRYMETSPQSSERIGWPWRKPGYNRNDPLYKNDKVASARAHRVLSKRVGMGEINTAKIARHYGPGRYAARYAQNLTVNGFNDWFLPSADELDLMYNRLYAMVEPIAKFAPTYYWSSSEYNLDNAWTQVFRSGQQFDREGWFTEKDTGLPNAMRVRAVRAFG